MFGFRENIMENDDDDDDDEMPGKILFLSLKAAFSHAGQTSATMRDNHLNTAPAQTQMLLALALLLLL